VTSVDVARRAGVSQSTVSLVLSGKSAGRISARTVEAVRTAAEELGYRPNVAARTLRTGVARTVGMVVTDVTHPFFGPVLRGAQLAAWRAGYAVTLVDVANDPDRERASFEALRAGPADGYMFFTVDPPEQSGEAVVAIEVSPPGMPFVRFDTGHGTDLAVRHLIALGHERIGHLGSELDGETFHIRREHLLARLAEAGLEPCGYETAAFRFDAAHRAALALLGDDGRRPTAVYCDDDLLAGGVYLAARDLGISIPDELSVVGFDDLPFAQVFEPPLTTVAIDPEALGASAFEVLAALMEGGSPEGRVLPVSLVVRGSTAPPREPTAAG
jgi:LacI family transcriptional regulator, repressor for deo operon, udp, cdd, tsx, nupC, and nupG